MIANRCPVCNGTGHVSAGFYESDGYAWVSSGGWEVCRPCSGTGVVWHDESKPPAYTSNPFRPMTAVDIAIMDLKETKP